MAKPSPSHAGSPLLIAIGDAVRNARTLKGMSQEMLALEAGLDRSYVGGIERGEHNVTVSNLHRIAHAVGVQPSELLKICGY